MQDSHDPLQMFKKSETPFLSEKGTVFTMNQKADADHSTYEWQTEVLIILSRILVESVLLVILSRAYNALSTGIQSSLSDFHRPSKVRDLCSLA